MAGQEPLKLSILVRIQVPEQINYVPARLWRGSDPFGFRLPKNKRVALVCFLIMEISPKYQMNLITQIEKKIWEDFGSYKNVKNYIKKWHKSSDGYSFNDYWENFKIYENDNKTINLNETLHAIDGELAIKIAIDLGVETPNFIPAIPVIKNVLKNNYSTAFNFFEKALKQIEDDPSLAVGLANSTFESIIKHILENDNIKIKYNKKHTLYDLCQSILKEYSLYPNEKLPDELLPIGSSLLSISKNIEKLRSKKTSFHGKTKKDYIIKDPLYAYFIVNTISTVGLFMLNFYEKKFNNIDICKDCLNEQLNIEDDIQVKDLPF